MINQIKELAKSVYKRHRNKVLAGAFISLSMWGTHIALRKSLVKPTYSNISVVAEYRDGTYGLDDEVVSYNEFLEKVPDQIQNMVNSYGGKIVYFNGVLKKQPEFQEGDFQAKWKERDPFEVSNAAYDNDTKRAFLGVKGDYYNKKPSDALHEYGHLMDFCIGPRIFGYPLSQTTEIALIHKKDMPRLNEYMQDRAEYIADTVRKYYESSETKAELKRDFPERYEWFRNVEEKAINLEYQIFRGY